MYKCRPSDFPTCRRRDPRWCKRLRSTDVPCSSPPYISTSDSSPVTWARLDARFSSLLFVRFRLGYVSYISTYFVALECQSHRLACHAECGRWRCGPVTLKWAHFSIWRGSLVWHAYPLANMGTCAVNRLAMSTKSTPFTLCIGTGGYGSSPGRYRVSCRHPTRCRSP